MHQIVKVFECTRLLIDNDAEMMHKYVDCGLELVWNQSQTRHLTGFAVKFIVCTILQLLLTCVTSIVPALVSGKKSVAIYCTD